MSIRIRRSWVVPIVFALACSNPEPPPTPPALDRPESVSFFCWDSDQGHVTAIENCVPADDDTGEPDEPFELSALVTQTGTGEVAAVQVTGSGTDDQRGVVDTDVRVPGFTFVPVGEVPSSVITPSVDQSFSYVVSRGSSDLHVIGTTSSRSGLGADVTAYPGYFLPGSHPSHAVLAQDEQSLLVALPERGEIWRVPIAGNTVGDPQVLTLSTTIPAPVDLSALSADQLPPDYRYMCPTTVTVLDPPISPPRAPLAPLAALPRPWKMTIDRELGRLLVSDRAYPMIHVIDIATMTELAPINVSVPTREVVVTPRVPTAPGTSDRTERFIYAIDDLDDSVLVVDYTDPGRGSFGGVLPVSVSAPSDRLTVPTSARALAVVTPNYSESGELPFCTDSEESAPTQLHGVFLAVATLDGRVRFFDIFDLDTPCRGASCSSVIPDADDVIVAIRRHRPRIGQFVSEPVQITPEPTWAIGSGLTSTLETDGTNNNPDLAPPLVAQSMCPAPLAPVYPLESAPLLCAITDPWDAISQVLTVTFDGTLPFTAESGGNFDGNAIDVRFDPCALGVLGQDDVPASGYLAGYPGDIVAITGELPLSLSDDERTACEQLLHLTSTTPVLLPILAAYTQPAGLRGSYVGRLIVGDPIGGGTLADVQQCFPELLQLEVRAQQAFVVQSTRDGFRHPVVRDPADGGCMVEPARVAALALGRAFCESSYVDAELAFTVGQCPASIERPSLQMTIGQVPQALAFNVSFDGEVDQPSLLAALEYNLLDQRLYAIDQGRRGLIRIRLTDLVVQGVFP